MSSNAPTPKWREWPADAPSHHKRPGNQPAKWRGQKLTGLQSASREVQNTTIAMSVVRRAHAHAERQVDAELERMLGMRVARGGWACPESPTGSCIYDPAEDPSHDECIICGEPSERK